MVAMKRLASFLMLCGLLCLASCNGGIEGGDSGSTTPSSPTASQTGNYVLTAWSELGMHCIDGKDYSVFSVLPPYNTLYAQVIQRGSSPAIVNGVKVTYQAIADSTGSVNTSSAGKTNFWTYVRTLFHASVNPDVGLTGT